MNQVKALIPGKHRTAARLIYGFLGAAFIAVSFY